MASLPSVHVQAHPPERRRRGTTTLHCGCSCCCCCCLHTLGGIMGAAVAPSLGAGTTPNFYSYYVDEEDNVVPVISKPGVAAVALFWRLLWIVSFVGLILSLLGGPGGIIVGLVVLVLMLPGVQLGCALVTFAYLGFSQRPDKWYQLKQLGKVTLGVIVGTGAGVLAMVGIGVALQGFRF